MKHSPLDSQSPSELSDSVDITTKTNESGHTVPLHSTAPFAEEMTAIRELQRKRGLRRGSSSQYLYTLNIENADEQHIKTLQPHKGRAKIDPQITNIRYVLDQYKQKKPDIELHHSFDFVRAFWEFIYNYFWLLAFPILIYREGLAGFWARDMLRLFDWLTGTSWITTNIVFWISSEEERMCFVFPYVVMNILQFARITVLAIKYGYYPTKTFDEYNDSEHKISREYLDSLHLIPGWLHQHPLAIGRELYYTEERFGIDLSKLRMTFRDTKAFDLWKGHNCSCSRYWTTLDWFIPYILLNVASGEKTLTSGKAFFGFMALVTLPVFYTTIARILPWSRAQVSFADCDIYTGGKRLCTFVSVLFGLFLLIMLPENCFV